MTQVSISPRGRAVAEALLIAASDLGHPSGVVQTRRTGYLVPDDVAQRYSQMRDGRTPALEDVESDSASAEPAALAPDASWKNADIEAYATSSGIDLGDATKKSDMLAVIAAAEKKE